MIAHHYTEKCKGFTLPELLIALLILGEIATFTIPKVLSAQQNSRNTAVVKEAASMVSGAFQQKAMTDGISSATKMSDLTPYMNYVSVSTASGTMDGFHSSGTVTCSATTPCLRLHSGATIAYDEVGAASAFNGTSTTHALLFLVDPDGRVTDGTTNGPGKALALFIYYNGRVSDYASITSPTRYQGFGDVTPSAASAPPWFQW